jgi:pentose-5-phosphate-3-epimerase
MIHVFDDELGVILFASETLFMKRETSLAEFALIVVTLLTITVMSANPDVRPLVFVDKDFNNIKRKKKKEKKYPLRFN